MCTYNTINTYTDRSLAWLEEHGYFLGCICNMLANYTFPSTNDVFAICHKFAPTIGDKAVPRI